MTKRIDEASRQQLLDKSKKADVVKSYGTTRYNRKDQQRLGNTTKNLNRIDFNALFKADLLDVFLPVIGETKEYIVEVYFDKICTNIQRQIKSNNNVCEYKCIYRALISAINNTDVYISCTCPDFCLDGDTEIKLLSGEVIKISDLVSRVKSGEDLWVYSVDETGDFKPGHISDVWQSGYSNEFIKVTLDNGKEILTTPNHRYMMRNGSFVEAEKLSVGDSLMPLYFKKDKKGYEQVKSNSRTDSTAFYSTYKIVANEVLSSEFESAKNRSGEGKIAIHHIDFNKSNNNPGNLKIMGFNEHYSYHYNHHRESGALEKFLAGGREYWSKEESREKQSILCREIMTNYYRNRTEGEILRDSQSRSNGSEEAWKRGCYNTDSFKGAALKRGEFLHTPEIERLSAKGLKNYWDSVDPKEKEERVEKSKIGVKKSWENKLGYIYRRISTVLQRIIDNGEIPSPDTYEKYKLAQNPNWKKWFNTWDDLSSHYNLNHKVVKVERIKYNENKPIYDISIDNYNNFFVNDGVILHNCYRQAYHASRGRYNSGQPQITPSRITNPNDTKGAGCKHIMKVLADLDWVLNVATCINNYIIYMEKEYNDKYREFIFPAIYGVSYERGLDMGLVGEEPEEEEPVEEPIDEPEEEPVEEPAGEEEETDVEV